MTGAYSRALLAPRLDEELQRAANTQGCLALFLFDVDFFKTVNDAYGHLRGDEVLHQLADRIKELIRGYDALFRYGGDEFVLLLPGTDRAAAIRLALRLTEEVRAEAFGADPPLHMSISLGVATYPQDGADATELLRVADRRNYLAKRRGRGGAVADDVETESDAGGSRLWERDAALAAVQEFFTRLEVAERGALRVTGEPGAGHTRFLAEVAKVAAMRGFTVVDVPADAPPPEVAGDRILLVADLAAAARAAEAVDRITRDTRRSSDARPGALGLVYATTGRPTEDPPLPPLATAELLPWSPTTLRIWLRNALHGEPSRSLV
ncbi:MAG TPA: GGDEF domain-containing protein, partial [Pilimelia sp.]|nr:GGDEF domain-containing protein [Pilimelia sp.]